jgi:hypothetical protein
MTQSASVQNDSHWLRTPESHILDLLRDGRPHTIEELLEKAPEFSWSQFFVAMDSLSRSAVIELRRHGFTYWLRKAELGE